MSKRFPARPALILFFCIYLAVLLKITVFRSGFSFTHLLGNGSINLTLFQEYGRLIRDNRFNEIVYLFVGNLIWFVPFGALLPAIRKKPTSPLLTVLWGFLLSLFIETAQYLFGTGVSELDDLILNTLGTTVGYLLYCWIQALRGRNRTQNP